MIGGQHSRDLASVEGVDLKGMAQGVVLNQSQLNVPGIKEGLLLGQDILRQQQGYLDKKMNNTWIRK